MMATATITAPAVATISDQYCTFWVDSLYFGIEVAHVQEVLRWHDVTPVPGAGPTVRGLINLRGQIVTALDLRRRLGLPEPAHTDAPLMNVVISSRREVVSLLVSEIGDVIDAAGHSLEPVPATVPHAVRSAVRGVLPLPDATVMILDPDVVADVIHHTPISASAHASTPEGTP